MQQSDPIRAAASRRRVERGAPRFGSFGGLIALAIILELIAAAALDGCTPAERYRALTFFFDGVPDPNAPEKSASVTLSSQFMVDTVARAVDRPGMRQHKPYREQPCTTCHPAERSFFLGDDFDLGGRCFTCHEHEGFRRDFEALPFQHGPVALGACLLCHDPHESLYPGLLTAPDPKLCYTCHERSAVLATEAHGDLAEERCLPCHDPHGGRTRSFVKRDPERPNGRG